MSFNLTQVSGFALAALLLIAAIQFSATSAAPDGFEPLVPNVDPNALGNSLNLKDDGSAKRLREGTQITDVIGYFRQDGDGATFVSEDGHEFGGLQNLNLERVVRTLKGTDETKRLKWSVSGLATEFMNRNFILISRAVYKSTALPPVPDQLTN